MSRLPLIGVTTCSVQIGLHGYCNSDDNTSRAVAMAARGMPMPVASVTDPFQPSDILDAVDSVLSCLSPSSVKPFHTTRRRRVKQRLTANSSQETHA